MKSSKLGFSPGPRFGPRNRVGPCAGIKRSDDSQWFSISTYCVPIRHHFRTFDQQLCIPTAMNESKVCCGVLHLYMNAEVFFLTICSPQVNDTSTSLLSSPFCGSLWHVEGVARVSVPFQPRVDCFLCVCFPSYSCSHREFCRKIRDPMPLILILFFGGGGGLLNPTHWKLN